MSETNLLIPGVSKGLNPAVDFKFLRDGSNSANHITKASFDVEDGNWDFFSRDFGTKWSYGEDQCAVKTF